MKELTLVDVRPLARRSPLAISLVLHVALLALLSLVHTEQPNEYRSLTHHKQSVIVLNFRDLPHRSRTTGASGEQSRNDDLGRPLLSSRTTAPALSNRALRPESPVEDAGASSMKPRRMFELSATAPVRTVKQTLVQLGVPPEVLLKQEVPLPNVVLWTPRAVEPFRKRFVTPPLKIQSSRVAQNLAPAPDAQLPNREPLVSDLKIAAMLVVSDRPRLFRPPSTTSPVRMPSPELINHVPQITLPDSNPAAPAALIALADNPTQPSGMVIVPPANQVSNSNAGGSSSAVSGAGADTAGAGRGSRANKSGSQESNGGLGRGAGAGQGSSDVIVVASSGGASPRGSGTSPEAGMGGGGSRSGGEGKERGPGEGTNGNANGNGTGRDIGLDEIPANVTRINLPKDGKFGVVVTGSSQATPYPESVGALGGKMVYTVYLSVGLHKKWILQYCLTKEAASLVPRGSATPIDAPWPYLMFRPDHLAQPGDYVIVHGVINTEGRFDLLAMVFPDEFDQKDLLINSLKLWSFRPASRDRQTTAVEILLIIPAES
ncbi:MAG: hypothetical protein ACJ74Y_04640 [Bryobacteraceae bacterium]